MTIRIPKSSCDDHIVARIKDGDDIPLDSLRRGEGHVGDGVVIDPDDHSIDTQRQDMSTVFSSIKHGDPCTPTIEGYAGETVQLRMIQGAQEVQHMFEVQGMSWPREIANPNSPKVAAQEIGISEHFEMDLPALNPALRARSYTDYLYRFSTVDDLWNGAWGLLRAFESSAENDPRCDGGNCNGVIGNRLTAVRSAGGGPSGYQLAFADDDPSQAETCPLDAKVRFFAVDAVTVKDVLGKPLLYNPDHSIADWDALAFMPIYGSTFDGRMVDELNNPFGETEYSSRWTRFGLFDEVEAIDPDEETADTANLLTAIKDGRLVERARLKQAGNFEPMVLRARAGECVIVRLTNLLLHNLDNGQIVPATNKDGSPRIKVDDNDDVEAHLKDENGYDPRHLPRIVPLNAVELQASEMVGMTAQMAHADVNTSGGAFVGGNLGPNDLLGSQIALPSESVTYVWYAGEMTTSVKDDGSSLVAKRKWTPKALGPINLVSLADPIEHGQQGLIGALIVEEADAIARNPTTYAALDDLPNGMSAFIDPQKKGKKPFHEVVLMYQDGLNLRWRNPDRPDTNDIEAVPDCIVCDDSYDRGEKAVNYRTEPFWARLNQHPTTDLNSRQFPPEFFLDDWKTIATPGVEVTEGDAVTFHVLQPYGRARQRTFMVLGHDYLDLLPHFGSRHSALISVGKAVKAELSTTGEPRSHKAAKGDWIWRDGPGQHFGSGVWGQFDVKAK